MRLCAGLVPSVAACLAAASPAGAEVYCADASPKNPGVRECQGPPNSIQGALDLAGAHPGPDTVGLNPGYYNDSPNLVYSDRGQPDNAVTIAEIARCGRYGCDQAYVIGTQPGALLSFTGGGGADVTVSGFGLVSENGTGLLLPPGGRAMGMFLAGSTAAVRVEGSAARPAVISSGTVAAARLGDPRGVGVDVAGHGILEHVWGWRAGRRAWRRLPGSFEDEVTPFGLGRVKFSGWLDGKRLRTGRYRLTARARGAPRRPVRVGFTVIR